MFLDVVASVNVKACVKNISMTKKNGLNRAGTKSSDKCEHAKNSNVGYNAGRYSSNSL